jgi:hypothetical protein
MFRTGPGVVRAWGRWPAFLTGFYGEAAVLPEPALSGPVHKIRISMVRLAWLPAYPHAAISLPGSAIFAGYPRQPVRRVPQR